MGLILNILLENLFSCVIIMVQLIYLFNFSTNINFNIFDFIFFYILTFILNSPFRKVISAFHHKLSTHKNVRRTWGKDEQFFQ
jgi:ABC-type transport system involved in cytochrome bd biosynthesis fused ATPase/permease subunit